MNSRRRFVQRLGAGALGPLVLSACAESPTAGAASGPDTGGPAEGLAAQGAADTAGTATHDTAADLSATTADTPDLWAALRALLQGAVLTPTGPTAQDYASARLLYNTRFDSIYPQAIARCHNASDVASALTFARKHALPFAIRGGGHSYAGYSTSTGLVIDTRLLNQITVLATPNSVRIGAGCILIDVYQALLDQGLLLPGGSGATVGIAGHTLGGGYGLSARQFGMLCDRLTGVSIVTADGQLRVCNAQNHSDLFWASRGGGGGSFGIVTDLTFNALTIPKAISWFSLQWPWSQAAQVVEAWQQWAPTAPDALTSLCHLFAGQEYGQAPSVSVVGQFFGTAAACQQALQPLLQVGKPGAPVILDETFGNLALLFAGCDTFAACHLQPLGKLPRETYRARSAYVTTPLPAAGVAALVTAMEIRHQGKPMGAVLLDAYGGAIGHLPADATAFVHRNVLYSAQFVAIGHSDDSATADAANFAWLNDIYAALQPFVAKQTYQNYVDAALPDWSSRYFGANYAKLQAVKAKYDPQDVFQFAQSVRLV